MAIPTTNNERIEIWRNIDSKYSVSSMGRVKRNNPKDNKKEKILSTKGCINGYPVVHILLNGKRKSYKVHQLVAQAFLENSDSLPCVNHKNGMKDDNRLENLEWCTYSYNIKHSYDFLNRTKTRCFNEKNYNSKKVINTVTGKEYPSLKQIFREEKLSYSYTAVRAMLNGQNPNKTNLIYAT